MNMNPNYNQTITIYNCLRGGDNSRSMKDVWKRTVIGSCFYKNVMGRVDSDKSSEMRNVYTVRIPEDEHYRPYHEWAALPDGEMEGYFTCSVGDIIVRGVCSDEITGASPHTASELLKRYKPDAFKVTAFSDNTGHVAGKHYRIGG